MDGPSLAERGRDACVAGARVLRFGSVPPGWVTAGTGKDVRVAAAKGDAGIALELEATSDIRCTARRPLILDRYRGKRVLVTVGGPTAGTNGNINPFTLPDGYLIWWTGMKVLKQDGSRHHGVGILPTIPAARTLAGVAAGRDEVLEKGIASRSSEPAPGRTGPHAASSALPAADGAPIARDQRWFA